jgi:hypothetical protein
LLVLPRIVLTLSLDEFVYNLRQFIDKVKTEDVVFNDIKSLTQNFAVSQTIFAKFTEIWKQLDIKDL